MNTSLHKLLWLGCLLVQMLGPGCATTESGHKATSRFHEAASANLILRFSRWDTIHVLRPESREDGFLPILTRDDLEARLNSEQLQRELAVVILGFLFSDAQEMSLAKEWAGLLQRHGFRRVVVVRTSAGNDVNGLPVVYDSLGRVSLVAPEGSSPGLAPLPPVVESVAFR